MAVMQDNEARHLVAIAEDTILVPYHIVKSLQLIWTLDTQISSTCAWSSNELPWLDKDSVSR